MKKTVICITALLLIISMISTVLAAGITYELPIIMYVNKDKLKVYADQTTDSKVLQKIKGGNTVTVVGESEDSQWYSILLPHDDILAWVQAKYITPTMPPEYCDHQYSDYIVDVEPTCKKEGHKYKTCSICGHVKEKTVPKKDHKVEDWETVRKATCDNPGLRRGECVHCDEIIEEEVTVPHEFGDWITEREPTCTNVGIKAKTCKNCGRKETKEIDKIDHQFNNWTVTTEATSNSCGIESKTCSMCGYTQTREFDPEGTLRNGARGDDVRAIQQLLKDQNYLKGNVDGQFGNQTKTAIMAFQKDAGLTIDGIAWPETIQKLHHEFNEWETVTEPTRTTSGSYQRTCKTCSYAETKTIEPAPSAKRGDRSEIVRIIQTMLNDLGFNAGTADGAYGNKTNTAFETFAQAQNIDSISDTIDPKNIDTLFDAWIKLQQTNNNIEICTNETLVNIELNITNDNDPLLENITWSISNMGTEKAKLIALVINNDDTTFTNNNIVLTIENKDIVNTMSGEITIPTTWTSETTAITAVCMSTKTNKYYMSTPIKLN